MTTRQDDLTEFLLDVAAGEFNMQHATLTAWDPATGENTVDLGGGATVDDLTVIGALETAALEDDVAVVVIRWRSRYYILGRASSSGDTSVTRRIATEEVTSDSSTFTTTETVVLSVTAPLVVGRTYRVRAWLNFEVSVGETIVTARIREDNTSGTQHSLARCFVPNTSAFGAPVIIEAEFTASSTGDQTFVVTGARSAGTGVINMAAVGSQPAYLYVDFIR